MRFIDSQQSKLSNRFLKNSLYKYVSCFLIETYLGKTILSILISSFFSSSSISILFSMLFNICFICANLSKIQILFTHHGGHNGFHGVKGCWGDELVKRWLLKIADSNNF